MLKYVFLLVLFASSAANAAGGGDITLKDKEWPFEGILGKVDKQAAQRGYQVYKEVCASCHGLKQVAYRNLQAIGFSEAEVKTIAAQYTVTDGPNDVGDMFDRPARPSDKFVSPYPNEQAARAANGGAYPVDLSLIIKARADGANYMYSLLTGYEDPPEDMKMMPGMYYNAYFPGHQIAMPPPLSDGLVDYQDGTEATVEQMSKDLTIFLQWAAEPEMESRKRMGVKVLLFLSVMTILLYLAKCRVWADLKKK